MANFNFSSFFGSSGSGSSLFGGINLSDYYLIKSGSYGKMMKSYYAKPKATTSANEDKTNKTAQQKAAELFTNPELSKTKSQADTLKKTAEDMDKSDAFKEKDGEYDMDKIYSTVKKFADAYNSTVENTSRTDSREVSQQAGYMKSMTNAISKTLAKVGISVGFDGKLSVDEEKLKGADVNDLKSLFTGKNSYASQIAEKAGAISSAAVKSTGFYNSTGGISSGLASIFNSWV